MRNFWYFIFVGFLLVFLLYARSVYSKEVRILKLSNQAVAKIMVSPRGTVLSFPTKPTKVILGARGVFGLEYVENDITISSLTRTSRANMFVYLDGRRFTFDLTTSEVQGDQIVLIRDQFDELIKAKVK